MPGNQVIISNSHVNSEQIVAGDHATLNQGAASPQAQLIQRLDKLLEEIERARLDDAQRMVATGVIEQMKTEAKSKSPSKSKFETGLRVVEKTASSVSGVMSAVKLVRQVVGLFFGV